MVTNDGYDEIENLLRINMYVSEIILCLDDLIEEESEKLIDEEQTYGLDSYIDSIMLKEDVKQALLMLTPRETTIISLRFGLDDGKPKTLQEVGEIIGVSRDRIRQIEAKAIRKLRHPFSSRKLKDYMESPYNYH